MASRTATRTLLLTDVVDSTSLTETLGDAAVAELWARHDRLARDLLPRHRGREIDKTDGFLLLFEEPADAVAYAVAYHRALRDLGLTARAGVHVGEVVLTENAPDDVARGAKPLEVDGIAKPTAARVMSVARGGQTLLTPAARRALGSTELTVCSHGHWRMKGVAEPVELFEVGDDDAPLQPPPDGAKVYRVVERDGLWVPVREVEHSLPAERDAFIGRAADLRALADAAASARLVSVVGTGGSGKTRLATRFGWTWLGDYPGGVWFCDLSEARSVEGIASAVARPLDVPLGARDPVARVGDVLAGLDSALVILDNFEQVARHAARTLGPWLDRAVAATFMVTTREVLGLPGETVLPLAPLADEEASALFVARARQASPGFEPTDATSIESLVALLDRLPLAIELAAARVRVMPPETMLQRMSERFRLLSSRGGRPSRQATLSATLDWSWDLLDPDEQRALAQLSVFEGGFTTAAAEEVLELDALWPLDAIQALVDKSLVRQVDDDRFDLLVSVQAYAADKLEGAGGRPDLEARHGAVFAAWGTDEAKAARRRRGGEAHLRAVAAELDNLVAACRRAVARGDARVAIRTLDGAWDGVLRRRGPFALGLELAERLLELPLDPYEQAEAHHLCGLALLYAHRTDEARPHLESALHGYRAAGDRRGEVQIIGALGAMLGTAGEDAAAQARFEAALALHRELGDRDGELMALGNLALAHTRQGHLQEASALLKEQQSLARELGDPQQEGMALERLCLLHLNTSQLDIARDHGEEALRLLREQGDRRYQGMVIAHLASVHARQGRTDTARNRWEEALALHREVGNRRMEGATLDNLGLLHLLHGPLDLAEVRLQSALTVWGELQDRKKEGETLLRLGFVYSRQGRIGAFRAMLAAAAARLREVGDSLASYAERECGAALRAVHEGDIERARETLAFVETLRAHLDEGPDSDLARQLAEATSVVEAAEAGGG